MKSNGRTLRLLTLINQVPWNELALREGSYAKSGRNKVIPRGKCLILLQTSKSRINRLAVDEQIMPKGWGRDAQGRVMQKEFDRLARAEIKKIPRGAIVGTAILRCTEVYKEGDGDYEYDLRKTRRFPKPIPITKIGPVRWHSVTVDKQLEKQLRKVGMWRLAKQSAMR